jgi:hypothetical protein
MVKLETTLVRGRCVGMVVWTHHGDRSTRAVGDLRGGKGRPCRGIAAGFGGRRDGAVTVGWRLLCPTLDIGRRTMLDPPRAGCLSDGVIQSERWVKRRPQQPGEVMESRLVGRCGSKDTGAEMRFVQGRTEDDWDFLVEAANGGPGLGGYAPRDVCNWGARQQEGMAAHCGNRSMAVRGRAAVSPRTGKGPGNIVLR